MFLISKRLWVVSLRYLRCRQTSLLCMVVRGRHSMKQVLIKWSALPETLETWEDMEARRQRFPLAPAWGQPASNGGGDVNTTTTPVIERLPGKELEDQPMGRHASGRERRPNVHVCGQEWVSPDVRGRGREI
jgi:hypothetical protein